jgi:hypothetical protein
MNLTQKQLRIQSRADKTLSFGCIITLKQESDYRHNHEMIFCWEWDRWDKYFLSNWDDAFNLYPYRFEDLFIEDNEGEAECLHKIIWHPMTRGRLSYLYLRHRNYDWAKESFDKLKAMFWFSDHNLIQKTILERPEELQDLVIEFLECLPDNSCIAE